MLGDGQMERVITCFKLVCNHKGSVETGCQAMLVLWHTTCQSCQGLVRKSGNQWHLIRSDATGLRRHRVADVKTQSE